MGDLFAASRGQSLNQTPRKFKLLTSCSRHARGRSDVSGSDTAGHGAETLHCEAIDGATVVYRIATKRLLEVRPGKPDLMIEPGWIGPSTPRCVASKRPLGDDIRSK